MTAPAATLAKAWNDSMRTVRAWRRRQREVPAELQPYSLAARLDSRTGGASRPHHHQERKGMAVADTSTFLDGKRGSVESRAM
jgi:polysaccharide deacetylase 2 family uncharacterized protein YibQ